MRELRECLRLGEQRAACTRQRALVRERLDDLQRNPAIERRVIGSVDLAHAARTEQRQHDVAAERRARLVGRDVFVPRGLGH